MGQSLKRQVQRTDRVGVLVGRVGRESLAAIWSTTSARLCIISMALSGSISLRYPLSDDRLPYDYPKTCVRSPLISHFPQRNNPESRLAFYCMAGSNFAVDWLK